MKIMPTTEMVIPANIFSLTGKGSDTIWAATSKGVYQINLTKKCGEKLNIQHTDTVYSVSCRDNVILVSSSWDKQILSSETNSCKLLHMYKCACRTGVTHSVISADKLRVIACTSDTPGLAIVLNDRLQAEGWLASSDGTFMSLASDPIENKIAIGDRDGNVLFFDLNTRQLLSKITLSKSNYIESLAYSPNGAILAAGSSDGSVILVDRQNGTHLLPRKHNGGVTSLIFSPCCTNLFVGFGDDGINCHRNNLVIACWQLEHDTRIDFELPGDGLVQSFYFPMHNDQLFIATSKGYLVSFGINQLVK